MIIENQYAKVEIGLLGANVLSFCLKQDGYERMWQGDATFWSGRNPILFPTIGSTASKSYRLDGKQYTIGNHGFARHSVFELVSHKEDEVILLLKENEETLKQYPYRFHLYVHYRLIDKKLEISYRVENTNDVDMYFTFGLHPAFMCPIDPNERFEDYWIEYHGLYNVERRPLTYKEYTNNQSVMFFHQDSPYYVLTNGKHGVKVSSNGYRNVILWSKENAPFICIEPWHGFKGEDHLEFQEFPGMMTLGASRSYLTSYSIEII
ncbi:MAG: aldose 1-epimerase family protein [Erysipelotrichaceae bacterium]|nr:aldose 1-epimerase family protein [Erysipelotrichaceae bacterium]